MSNTIRVSVVVPLFDEEGNVRALVEAVREALEGWAWELLLVDDGSRDGTAREIRGAVRADSRVRGVLLARNVGQTGATQEGLDRARGRVVVTMDGDLQNDPRDIPGLVAKLEEGYDLVTGYRERRQDPWLTRRVPSWVANRLIRWVTGVPVRDNGCSLKVYRRELVERLFLYAEMHRFIPAVAVATAGARVTEVPVRHHPRRVGASKYGLGRSWRVASDLLAVAVLRSFRERPLLLFGGAGLVAVVLGVVLALGGLGAGPGEAGLVLPTLGALVAGLGAYLAMLGLLTEAAVHHAARRAPARSILVREGVEAR